MTFIYLIINLITSTTLNSNIYQNNIKYHSRVTNYHINRYQVIQKSYQKINQATAILGSNILISKESIYVS